jgi:hypothetical protein
VQGERRLPRGRLRVQQGGAQGERREGPRSPPVRPASGAATQGASAGRALQLASGADPVAVGRRGPGRGRADLVQGGAARPTRPASGARARTPGGTAGERREGLRVPRSGLGSQGGGGRRVGDGSGIFVVIFGECPV